MEVKIITFPKTKTAVINHQGPPELEHQTVMKLVKWKLANQLVNPELNRHYGLHYTDASKFSPVEHRVEFCLSIDDNTEINHNEIYEKTIPSLKCAMARDIGSRENNQAARYLYETWLPVSGEEMADYPIIFHYVNVGPNVKAHEAITDVYLPIN